VSPHPADLLARLIQHRTTNPGGDEPGLCRALAAMLAERGADDVVVELVPRPDGDGTGAYVYARFGAPALLFNAHIDTVPINRGWTRDPFGGTSEGGNLYGLGAADTKGAVAAALCALERERPDGLAILFSGDEEHGASCMRAFLASPRAAGIERALVSEPTSRRAVVRHRGVAAARAEVTCAGGHSSRVDGMAKPMVALARLAVELDQLGRRWLDRGPPGMNGLCMNIAGFEGGVAFNVVPDRAAMTFSYRPPPGCDRTELDRDLTEAVARAALEEGPAVRIARIMDRGAFGTADVDRFRPILGDRLVDAAGELDFWTEAAVLAEVGIDAVVIGPGEVAQAHAADEHVPIADLEWATDLYTEVFRRSRASRGS
jgi:acetylornithine deacetylase